MAAFLRSVFALQAMFLLFVAVAVAGAASAAPRGFTADLIRRDSPKSPFYNPEETRYQRTRRLLRSRLASDSHGSPFSDTIADWGEYLMKIQIGTPPFEVVGVADTGSDLVWTQCLPCVNCFRQDASVFNPVTSSTYRDVSCASSQCQRVYRVPCHGKDGACPYSAVYGTGSSASFGSIGVDTVTLRSTSGEPFVMPEAVIGCGHNSTGFNSHMSGIVGLGWGPSSLISQMGDTIQGLFSYCFGAATGKINFGANAVVSGDGTVSTTLFRKSYRRSNYFLNLEAVSVGSVRVETKGTSMQSSDGNMIIDSGSTATVLSQDYFLLVKAAIDSAMEAETTDSADRPCYSMRNLDEFPVITFHFSGADLVLGRSNTYVNGGPGVICLGFVAGDGIPPIFGNLAQSNLLVGYDTLSEIISFKPTNCSAWWS